MHRSERGRLENISLLSKCVGKNSMKQNPLIGQKMMLHSIWIQLTLNFVLRLELFHRKYEFMDFYTMFVGTSLWMMIICRLNLVLRFIACKIWFYLNNNIDHPYCLVFFLWFGAKMSWLLWLRISFLRKINNMDNNHKSTAYKKLYNQFN